MRRRRHRVRVGGVRYGRARAWAFLPNSLSKVGLSSSTMLLLSRSQICAAPPRQHGRGHSPASVTSCFTCFSVWLCDAMAVAACQRRLFDLVRVKTHPGSNLFATQSAW